MKPAGPNNYYPGMPSTLDPKAQQILEHLLDRVNFLLNEVAGIRSSGATMAQDTAAKVDKLQVALQAATDPTAAGTTFVGFGQNTPISSSPVIDGSGVGYQFTSGSGGSLTMSVSSASTARSSISAAQKTAVGAHTITLAALTGGGTQGSISWNADGCVSAFVDPT